MSRSRSRTVATLLTLVLLVAVAGTAAMVLRRATHAQAAQPMEADNVPMQSLLQPIPDGTPNAQQLRQGRYLVIAGDCASCHTPQGGPLLTGGLPLNSPFGTLYSTNLTPDAETGLGGWDAERFYAALHDGRGSQGPLYPAMPYPYFTHITRADSDAMLAFLKTLPPVKSARRDNRLSFPFSVRTLVHGWNLLNFRSGEFAPDPARSAQWNRGAYLVEGLGHCGACHTPKDALAGDRKQFALQGGMLENWVAPDLSGNPRTGLGRWRAEEIVEFLRTGRNAHANAGGTMAEVVTRSTSLMSNADLEAIAVYLKDRPASADATPDTPDAGAMRRGEAIFADACTACHMTQAKGQPGLFPPLAGNAIVQQADPTGVLHIILAGVRTATTAARVSPLAMPSFAWKLTDRQVADVATYVRNSHGNRAQPVTPQQVAALRARLGLDKVHPAIRAAGTGGAVGPGSP